METTQNKNNFKNNNSNGNIVQKKKRYFGDKKPKEAVATAETVQPEVKKITIKELEEKNKQLGTSVPQKQARPNNRRRPTTKKSVSAQTPSERKQNQPEKKRNFDELLQSTDVINALLISDSGKSAEAPENKPKQSARPQRNSRPRRNIKAGKNAVPPASIFAAPKVKIISLGGLNEIGKNCTVFECGDDIFIVDCGIAFPDEELLGIDLVIPDFDYLEKNADRIRGMVLTHGHEDHIGSIPYLLKKVSVPIYGTLLTLGLLEGKLKEHGLLGTSKLHTVSAGDKIKLGCFEIEFIRVNHSIPDAVGMAITTPAGIIIHTGDFKIDYTPIQGGVIDLAKFAEYGTRGVLALLMDSTNAERPGATMSERKVGQSFEPLFKRAADKRILIATFASNIQRIQQIVDAAVKYGRKVAVSGRSMENAVAKATELGYLNVPENVLIDMDLIKRYQDSQLVIITTGSQGEPMSALSRMANGDHRKVEITGNDFIIISANPIPGNEKFVGRVVNELMKLGADVIYENIYEVHVSGHACQEELKLMLTLIKPKYFMPVHGEYKHLMKNAAVAESLGYDSKHIIISDIGKVVEIENGEMKINGAVTAGRVLVDGLGVGDVGNIVLRDRKHLAEDGLIIVVMVMDKASGQIVSGPDIISRGFVYVREAEDLIGGAKNIVLDTIEGCNPQALHEWSSLKLTLRDVLSAYIWQKTKRNPMILPLIMEA